jgi:two-component system LytT family response regulator
MKILIIEDEVAAAQRLGKLIRKVNPSNEIIEVLQSVESAVEWLHENAHNEVDLAMMDIQLADGTSFEIFELAKVDFPVIFTTAYDEYALQAFKVNAIDYLLKPIKSNELEKALNKYEKLNAPFKESYSRLIQNMRDTSYKQRFVVKVGRTIKIIKTEDIAYFYTEAKISFVTNKSGKRYPVDISLDHLEEMLDPNIFYRANRQFIININAIKEMYAYSKARVKIGLDPPCDREVIVSTERSSRFKKWLSGD